ncbi:MAG: ROK family transcriptional regulator [Candidatus Omnitrophica bacterium]|nr:ROK family transcriptional regulator [Candidatus Omnitrophota bacterium]
MSISESILSDHERKNLAILETVRKEGPLSRTDISKTTKFNIVTVSNYINSFIKQGLVLEKGLDASSGGRRPEIVELNPSFGYVVGVDLSLERISVVLADLSARIISKASAPRPREDAEGVVNALLDLIAEVIKKSGKEHTKVRGVCVGASGVIDKEAGTIHCTEGTTSIYVPLATLIEQKFDVPAFIENDATAASYGEWCLSLGHVADIKSMIYMYSGVGCGIIIDGEIYHGSSGSAGEPSIKWSEEKPLCDQGPACALMPWVLDLGMGQQVLDAVKRGTQTKIAVTDGVVEMEDIFRAARDNDPLAMEVIKRAGSNLGMKVAFIVNLLNPGVVMIGGGIEQAGSLLIDSLKKAIRDYAFDEMANAAKIVPARLGDDSVSLGSASLVIRGVFAQS